MKPNALLLGMPRSGTTWVAKIIDSHPNVTYFHEPDSVFPLKKVPLYLSDDLNGTESTKSSTSNSSASVEEQDKIIDTIRTFLHGFPYINEKCLGKRPFFRKNGIPELTNRFMQYSILASKALGRNLIYFPQKRFEKNQSLVFFKSIESVGRLSAFLKADNELKIIFIVRSPFGQINSVLKGSQAKQFDHNDMLSVPDTELTNLYHAFGDQPFALDQVLAFTPLQQLAYRWLAYNEKALREAKQFLGRVQVVNYDSLCDSARQPTKDMLTFLGLDFDDQSKGFLEQSNQSHNTDYYSVVKDANKVKNAWRNNFSDQQINEITHVVKNTESGALFGL